MVMEEKRIVIAPGYRSDTSHTSSLGSLIRAAEEDGLQPVLLAMDTERDTAECETLSRGRYPVLTGLTESEVSELLRGSHAAVCCRLHAAVLAAACGVPFVCLDADGRLRAFCDYAGVGECVAESEADTVVSAYRRLRPLTEEQRESVRSLVRLVEEDVRALVDAIG